MHKAERTTDYRNSSCATSLDGVSFAGGRQQRDQRFAFYNAYSRQDGRIESPRVGSYARSVASAEAQLKASSNWLKPSDDKPNTPLSSQEFDLPAYTDPDRPKHIVKRRASFRKGFIRSASVFMVLMTIGGSAMAMGGYFKMNKVLHGKTTVAALASQSVVPTQLKGEGDGRVNILLLGAGGKNHDGPELTDTIMILSVDPVGHQAALLSVPRDMWVKTDSQSTSYQKINAVFTNAKAKVKSKSNLLTSKEAITEAGFAALDQKLGEVLGIKIDYHVYLDFAGFAHAIDAVDGITVNVAQSLNDPTMAWENSNNPILAQAGVQNMNGKQALLYVRSRHTSSDFARSERQRQVLVALKNKATTLQSLTNPAKLTALMNGFANNMYSDMSPSGAMRLMMVMQGVGSENIESISLTDGPSPLVKPMMEGNISTVQPVSGVNNYADIHDFVRSKLHDGYLSKEKAGVFVISKTKEQATSTASLLLSYGYNVLGSAQVPHLSQASPRMIDASNETAPYTKHYLVGRYEEVGLGQMPSGISVPVGTKFVILDSK